MNEPSHTSKKLLGEISLVMLRHTCDAMAYGGSDEGEVTDSLLKMIEETLCAERLQAANAERATIVGALHSALPHDFAEPDENKIIGRVAEFVRGAVADRDQVMWSVAETMTMFEQGATAEESMQHLKGRLKLLYDTKKEN
jgi:hypothetical protein